MTQIPWRVVNQRWVVVAPALAASVIPAMLLTLTFDHTATAVTTFIHCWIEILVGPLKYWLPILTGHPSEYAIHPMAGITIWVYLICLLLTFTHPVKPNVATASMTIVGACVWYGWVFLAIAAVAY